MKKAHVIVTVLVLVLALSAPKGALAAQLPPCGPSATVSDLSGAFPAEMTILNSPLLQATLVGFTGTFTGHVVFTPLSAPPPAVSDGCKENSRFTAEDFTGVLFASGPVALQLFGGSPFPVLVAEQPTDLSLQVHFGTEPNKPILTFRSTEPVLFLGQPVRFVQIIGLQIVASQ